MLKILSFSQNLKMRLIMQRTECMNLVVLSHLEPTAREACGESNC